MTEGFDNKTCVKNLVYMYDLSCLGVESHLPTYMKNYSITQELLDQYCPSFDERTEDIARQSCWYAYVSITPKPDYSEFNTHVLPNALQKVKENVALKLNQTVPVNALQEIVKKQSLNLTQVDKDRQIQ